MKAQVLIILAFEFSWLCGSPCSAQDLGDLHNRMKDGVVLIQSLGGGRKEKAGTGFVIDHSGIVLTNRHVISESSSVFATFPTENSAPIKCLLIDESATHDLAALQLERAVPLATPKFELDVVNDPQAVAEVLVIGHPRSLNWSVHRGNVSGIRKKSDLTGIPGDANVKVIQIDVSAASGMSGAPVLLDNGKTVGVFTSGIDHGRLNLNFCVHSTHVKELNLKKNPMAFGQNGQILSSTFINSGIDYLADPSIQRNIAKGTFRPNSQHWGTIPRDATLIYRYYIEDQERFDRFIKLEHMQQLLRNKNVTHVTNPHLCYSVVVPEGYRLSERITPTGVFVSNYSRHGSNGGVDITAYPIPNPPRDKNEQSIALNRYAGFFAFSKLKALRIGLTDPLDPNAVELGPYSEVDTWISPRSGAMRHWRHYANHPRFNRSVMVMYAVHKDVFYTVDIEFPTNVVNSPILPDRFVEDMFIAHTFSFVN